MKTLFLAIVIFILSLMNFNRTVNAQESTADIRLKGIVLDSISGQPLEFLTVNLLTETSELLKTEYTRQDGSFEFSTLKSQVYTLIVMGVGYAPKSVPVNLIQYKDHNFKLSNVLMSPQSTHLNEVKVTAAKTIIKQEVDRISYDLQADPESKVYSVLEMMRKVPHLSLDANDNILLKGNTDFKILINGKPSSMVERSYKEILRSMPASSIEKIEVITTPPAKYDAEGLGGIINIITNKKVDNGFNGSLNVSERFRVGGPGIGGSFSGKFGKWGMSAFAGGNIFNTPQTDNAIYRYTYGENPTLLTQRGSERVDNKSGYLGYEISYELDSLNLISGQINLNGNQYKGRFTRLSTFTSNDEVLQNYFLNQINGDNGTGMDAALNYQRGFKSNKNQLLTFSYRYFKYDNNQVNEIGFSERLNYFLPDYHQLNDQHFAEQTIQVDYVYPIRKVTMEAGIKGILRNNRSDFQYLGYDEESDIYKIDPSQTNQFVNSQNVFGIYNTYQYSFKNWSIKAGGRVESTLIRADFVSVDTQLDKKYLNFIPSISINRKLNDKNGVNLGYTQRIQRPGISRLNPFVDKSNPNFERTGNPDLKPSTVNEIQLGYNLIQKYTLNLGLGYAFFKELIFPIVVYSPETGITRSSFGNTGKARLPMINMSLNYPFAKRWNGNLNARAAYGIVEGIVNDEIIKNRGLMYQINLSSGYRFEKNWKVNGNLNVNGPNLTFQGSTNLRVNTSFSINKDVIKDKLSFAVAVNNPFSKLREDYRETFGTLFFQENYRTEYFRSFNVSLNYKFGKLKEAVKKSKRGIRNDDIQGN